MQTAANAGVPQDQAGLAAALITTSFQLGSALGLAVFSGIATSRTSHLPNGKTSERAALNGRGPTNVSRDSYDHALPVLVMIDVRGK